MSSDGENGGNGGGRKLLLTILLTFGAVVAGYYGLKLTLWAAKTALFLGAAGAAAYVGYRGYKLLSSNKPKAPKLLPKQLTSEVPTKPTPARPDPADIDDELEKLKQLMLDE
jgi:uncharacterized membrane protein YebE (DUF533 family)